MKNPLVFINLLGYVKSWGNVTFDENAVYMGAEDGVWDSLLLSPKVLSVDLTMLLFFLKRDEGVTVHLGTKSTKTKIWV